jgi:hypothetical protein
MRTTIDRAGRVVTLDEEGVQLRRVAPRPKLVRERGRLVVRPTVPYEECPEIDVPELIREERERWPW